MSFSFKDFTNVIKGYVPVIMTENHLQQIRDREVINGQDEERKWWDMERGTGKYANTTGEGGPQFSRLDDFYLAHEGNQSMELGLPDCKKEGGRLKKILEAATGGWVTTRDQNNLGRSISRSWTREQLWAFQEAAWIKATMDPRGQSIVNNMQFYTIGNGLKVDTASKEVNKVIKDFRNMNDMELREKSIVKESFIEGEYFYLFFIDKNTGDIRMRKIPPQEITDIDTHPEDKETRLAYHRESNALNDKGSPLDVWYPDINYFNQSFDEQISDHVSKFEDDKLVMFQKYGYQNEVRGRVPMASILRFLKYYEDFIIDRIRLHHERAKVVWIRTIQGSGRDVQADNRGNPLLAPKGGTMWTETPNIRYRIESAKLDSGDAEKDGLLILYTIASGVTQPIHILEQRADQAVYSCLSANCGILTPTGWKTYDQINEGSLVGTINPSTHQMEWQLVNEKFVYPFDGDLHCLEGKSTSFEVTPNHDLYISPREKLTPRDSVLPESFEKFRADSIPRQAFWALSSLNWSESVSLNPRNDNQEIPSFIQPEKLDHWLKGLAAYVGDGCLSMAGKGRVYPITRVCFKKERKIKYFLESLEEIGFNHHKSERTKKVKSSSYNKELYNWLDQEVGRSSHVKRLPSFIFALPTEKQQLFFESLIQSDGSRSARPNRTRIMYTTTSEQLKEDMMLLGLRLGYRSVIVKTGEIGDEVQCPSGVTTRKAHFYRVKFIKQTMELLNREKIQKVPYKGHVWCVNVDNGLIVTRLNGKIAIHGNSLRATDSPFSQMIESNQDFHRIYQEKIYRLLLKEKLEAGKLPKTVKIEKVDDDVAEAIMHRVNEMIIEGCGVDEIIIEAENNLKDKKKFENIKTEDIDLTITFPDVIKENPLDNAKVMLIHDRLKIVSKRTMASRAGYNWVSELRQMRREMDNPVLNPPPIVEPNAQGGIKQKKDDLEKGKADGAKPGDIDRSVRRSGSGRLDNEIR